jgi:hypothetical protein
MAWLSASSFKHGCRALARQCLVSTEFSDAVVYETKDEEVLVRYSTGRCREKWDVPRDTIIYIQVLPKKKPKFSDLNLDKSKYKKRQDPEVLDYSDYDNEEDGFELNVNTAEDLVYIFIYYASGKDQKLQCAPAVTPNKRLERTRR